MIHYKKIGSGKPILLIHGFPNDSSNWDNVLPHLSKAYQYILIDLPGAGKSPVCTPLTLTNMALSLKEVLDKENIDQALFVGHSMGGYTTMEATQHFPERIKAISLVHSLASGDSEATKQLRRKSILLINRDEKSKMVFLKTMAEALIGKTYKEMNPEASSIIIINGLKLPTETLAGYYEAMMHRSDKVAWLATNKEIPIQWIIGTEDTATTMESALQQCYLSAVNEVQLYHNIGHMSMFECPERLAEDLNRYFEFIYGKN
ncbi:MAG TPA: alpha/beta hydrolase [Edaphocola sp.]|nr:alpha/beta hydrolase [Edaphocola sp.]